MVFIMGQWQQKKQIKDIGFVYSMYIANNNKNFEYRMQKIYVGRQGIRFLQQRHNMKI